MSDSATRLLYLLKSRGPLATQVLAGLLGMTTPGVRQHLAKLQAQDLVEHADEPAGVGRPRRIWRLARSGHERFPDTHADLIISLIASARSVFGAKGLDRLIQQRETEALVAYRSALAGARTLGTRLRALVKLRTAEGYMAEATRQPDGSYLFIENHCPICAAATACQGFCRSELDVFRTLLAPAASVERCEHLLAGARRCAYRVTPTAKTSPGTKR